MRRTVSMTNGGEKCRASASAVGCGDIRPARPRRANPMTASGSRWCAMRAVLWLTVGSTWLFGCVGPARAQTQATPVGGVPSADVPAAVATPGLTEPPLDRALMLDEVEAGDPPAFPEFLPGTLPPGAGAPVEPIVSPSAAPSRPVNSGLGDLVLIATCLYSGVWCRVSVAVFPLVLLARSEAWPERLRPCHWRLAMPGFPGVVLIPLGRLQT